MLHKTNIFVLRDFFSFVEAFVQQIFENAGITVYTISQRNEVFYEKIAYFVRTGITRSAYMPKQQVCICWEGDDPKYQIERQLRDIPDVIQKQLMEYRSNTPHLYFHVYDMLLYLAEYIHVFGYKKGKTVFETMRYYTAAKRLKRCEYDLKEAIYGEMAINRFDEQNQREYVNSVIEWVHENASSNHQLYLIKEIIDNQYAPDTQAPLLASVFSLYEQPPMIVGAKFNGNVGDRIEIDVFSHKLLTKRDTPYGICYTYHILDKRGYVYIWNAWKEWDDTMKLLSATIVKIQSYNGECQMVVKNCRRLQKRKEVV